MGALTLQVGGSTCGTSRSICAEGEPGRTVLVRATDLNGTTLTLGDAAAAGIALRSYVQIDAEVMRVDAIDVRHAHRRAGTGLHGRHIAPGRGVRCGRHGSRARVSLLVPGHETQALCRSPRL